MPATPPTMPATPPTMPATPPTATLEIPTRADLEEGELEEEEIEEPEHTAESIGKLALADLRRLAESNGIPTKENGKALKLAQLRQSVCDHFNV
jgi:hypothetical protein